MEGWDGEAATLLNACSLGRLAVALRKHRALLRHLVEALPVPGVEALPVLGEAPLPEVSPSFT